MPKAAIFGCEGLMLSADEKALFRESDPWGFILFARNLKAPAQISALTNELRETVGRNAPILIDQEGGRVARLRPPHWLEWLPAFDQMRASKPGFAARGMWIRYRLIADELRLLGIDVNCAPLADLVTPQIHPALRNRCYGETVEQVVSAARAVADGLLAGGVLPVLKHIPGHGRPSADSHDELPRTDTSAETLKDSDFAAFRTLADLPLGMTAHVVYEAIDPARCATQSPVMINLIRHEIGFDGLLMSDDLSMSALSGTLAQRTEAALKAGCDLVLHCNGDMAEMTGVAGAAGELSASAATRADRALACRNVAEKIDRNALLAELRAGLMLADDERANTP